ncbi:hypothetical protein Moror_8471 [Moniliophthora roreri MCA 2997]|uniref:Uncharacterized protein n=1 Tax=Moniliophthora roreri (strain MCA 2997) TaxID=1381753 RepID=V2WM41_MONRO|nr:hypothetical protein Moror_8471 [Moniliophthora roreri MCA 2997]
MDLFRIRITCCHSYYQILIHLTIKPSRLLPSYKARGLSNRVSVRSGGRFALAGNAQTRSVEKVVKTREKEKAQRRRYQTMLGAMNFEQREVHEAGPSNLADTPNFDDHPGATEPSDPMYRQDLESDPDEPMNIDPIALMQFPPGEEGAINSHAGAEYSFDKILSSLLAHKRQRADDRTRTQRVQKTVDAWQDQRQALVRAYLAFQSHGPPETIAGSEEWPLSVMDFTGAFAK